MSLTKTLSVPRESTFPDFLLYDASENESIELTFTINQFQVTGDTTCEIVFLVEKTGSTYTGSYRGTFTFSDLNNPTADAYSQLETYLNSKYGS